MFNISNSSISIVSAALAAPAHAGFHRENPRLTDYQDSENGFSNKPGASQKNIYTRLRSLVVRTSDFSMIKRVLKGISHPGLLFSGYFDRSLGRGSSSILERKSFNLDVVGGWPTPSAIGKVRESVYRLVFGQVVIQLILGLDHVEFRALPFPTKIAA